MYQQLLLHAMMKNEQQRLEQRKYKLEQELKTLPDGSIYEKNGNFYHIFRVEGKQKMHSIKDPQLLHQLRVKRHIRMSLPQITSRLENCNLFLKNDELYDAGKKVLELPERYRTEKNESFWLPGDVDPEIWGKEEYERNPWAIKKPNRTTGGRIVRSKSESFIGSEIEDVPLFYRYEQKLVLFGEVFYPDFMFVLPGCRMIVIWEHFGMMDDPEYLKKAMYKFDIYSRAGWILGRNFFFTYETEADPFTLYEARKKLKEILALDKVIW